MNDFPQLSDCPLPKPWISTVLLSIVFTLPGTLSSLIASMAGQSWASLMALGWAVAGALGIWLLWHRRRDRAYAWWTDALAPVPLGTIVAQLENKELDAEALLDVVAYLQEFRQGWSTHLNTPGNPDTLPPCPPTPTPSPSDP